MGEAADNDRTGQLVAAARSGDAAARDELFREHLPGLRAFVRLKSDAPLRQRESQSDLVQSICREVLSDLDAFEYRGPASFKNWMFTLAINKIRQKVRFHRAARRDPDRERGPGERSDADLVASYASVANPCRSAIAREEMLRFEAAFDRLDADQQDVIVWSRLVGLPHREIAERLGRTEQATRSLLSRALARLSTGLK